MSDELESMGALATAGLASATMEGVKHDGKDPAAHGACANCKAVLTGPYCTMCGQPAHIHRSLLHLVEEVLHGILHFDTKTWRTIPLLIFSPGKLTRSYIDGQRKNYVSPLALFLFMVFLSFFMASLTNNKQGDTSSEKSADKTTAAASLLTKAAKYATAAKSATQLVSQLEGKLEATRKQGGDVAEVQEELADARKDLQEAQDNLSQYTTAASAATSAATAALSVAASATSSASATGGSAPVVIVDGKSMVNVGHIPVDQDDSVAEKLADEVRKQSWLHSSIPAVEEALKHALDNPDLALYKLKNTTYKFSFMLVPISLPFLWLMFFWKRGVVMFDHAVFVLYSLCFMSLLFVLLVLLSFANWAAPIVILALLTPPLHMFAQLRGTYGLGKFSALWRTIVLLGVAGVVLILFMIFVLMMSMH